MDFYIYVIFAEPDVYIGYTRNIKRRMAEHYNPPFWAILEKVDGSLVREVEVKWIKTFTELGAGLLNRNRDFSNGCLHLSEDARRRVSTFHKGKTLSKGHRRKIADALRQNFLQTGETNYSGFWKSMTPKQRSTFIKNQCLTSKGIAALNAGRERVNRGDLKAKASATRRANLLVVRSRDPRTGRFGAVV